MQRADTHDPVAGTRVRPTQNRDYYHQKIQKNVRRGREAPHRATIAVSAGWGTHRAPHHARGNEQHDEHTDREVPTNLAVRARVLVDLRHRPTNPELKHDEH